MADKNQAAIIVHKPMFKKNHFLARAGAALVLASAILPASAELIHRYSFTTDANDSVGTAHGAAVQLSDATGPVGAPVEFLDGQATLDGFGGYIDLPNGIISALTNISIETWVTSTSGANWSRIFDFGNSTTGETSPSQAIGTGLNYMFLTPNGAGSGMARFAITDASNGGERPILNDTEPFPEDEVHLAITYGEGFARIFVNGRLAASGTAEVPLSALQDVNNWLGRSQWADPLFGGSYNEFRIHNHLLSGLEVKASSVGGPDQLSYDPGTVTSVALDLETSMIVGATQIPQITGTFSGIGEIAIGVPDVTVTSSDTNVVAVTATGSLTAVGVGTATIRVARDNQSAEVNISVSPGAPADLKHRYSFSEAANALTVVDSVGAANGTVNGGASGTNTVGLGTGSAVFPPAAGYTEGTYIDLPDGIISTKTNITIETWITWNGPANQDWQRIFDFGDSEKGSDPHVAGNGLGYLFLTPRSGGGNTPRFAGRPNNTTAENPTLNAPSALPLNQEAHFALIYAPEYQVSRLYINGIAVASGMAPFALNTLSDVNNWLGLSQYNDPPFNGSINEFRIHEGLMTELDVALSLAAGPDALPVAPGPLESISLLSIPSFPVGTPATTLAILSGNFQNVSNVNLSGAGALFTSSDTNVFTVSAFGLVTPRNVGTASLITTYLGQSVTGAVSVLAPTALRHDFAATLPEGGAPVTPTLRADFAGTNDVNVTGFAGVTHSSSNTNVVNIVNGNLVAMARGNATITSGYAGLTSQTEVTVGSVPGFQRGTLVHRYSFSGAPDTTEVTDSVGTAHGELIGLNPGLETNNFTGTGQVTLDGGAWNDFELNYVNLPNGLVSTLNSVTIEGWATWNGGAANQRFFDFGMSSGAPDGSGGFDEDFVANPGMSYMFLTPSGPRFAINTGTVPENPSITSSIPIAQGTNIHYAVIYDPPNGVARLYINGQRAGTAAATLPLSVVDDRNNWLGRSVWQDPLFSGSFDEFRIYNGPLLDADIAASYAAGPNQLPDLTPGASLTASLSGQNIEITWPETSTGFSLETTAQLGTGATWTAVTATPTTEGGNFKVSVPRGTGDAYFRLRR
jgi:hypothetical protein